MFLTNKMSTIIYLSYNNDYEPNKAASVLSPSN